MKDVNKEYNLKPEHFSDEESSNEEKFEPISENERYGLRPEDFEDKPEKLSWIQKTEGNSPALGKALGLGAIQGIGTGVSSALNLPLMLAERLTGYHASVPYPHIKPEPGYETPFNIGSAAGQAFIPGNIIKGAGKLGAIGQAASGAGAGYLFGGQEDNPDERLISSLMGAGAPIVGKAIVGLSNTIPAVKEFGKNLSKFITTNPKAELINLENKLENVYKEAQQHFNPKSKSMTAEDLSKTLIEEKNKIRKEFNTRYSDFNKTTGKMEIKNPIDEVRSKNIITDITGTIPNPGKNIINLGINNPVNGKPFNIKLPSENGTVSEYVDLMRDSRDAADALRREASTSNRITQSEKEHLITQSNKLEKLSQEAAGRAQQSMSSQELGTFKKLQSDYKNIAVPLKQSTQIKNVTNKKIVSKDIFSHLLQPANKYLRQRLTENPKTREAILSHALQGTGHPLANGAEGLGEFFSKNKIGNEDIFNFLSSKQKDVLLKAHKAHGEVKNKKQEIAQMDAFKKQLGHIGIGGGATVGAIKSYDLLKDFLSNIGNNSVTSNHES